jgi:hypothetical protein
MPNLSGTAGPAPTSGSPVTRRPALTSNPVEFSTIQPTGAASQVGHQLEGVTGTTFPRNRGSSLVTRRIEIGNANWNGAGCPRASRQRAGAGAACRCFGSPRTGIEYGVRRGSCRVGCRPRGGPSCGRHTSRQSGSSRVLNPARSPRSSRNLRHSRPACPRAPPPWRGTERRAGSGCPWDSAPSHPTIPRGQGAAARPATSARRGTE